MVLDSYASMLKKTTISLTKKASYRVKGFSD
jgi:hypothetical protein